MEENKFTFGLEYQDELIRFVLVNDDGYKAMAYIKNSYFATLSRSTIFFAIERHWGETHRIPGIPFLMERFSEIFKERMFAEALTEEDKQEIINTTRHLTNAPAKDGDLLLASAAKFASYIELKDTIENIDLANYAAYGAFSGKVQEAISISDVNRKQKEGIFFIKGLKERQVNRQATDIVIPTPFAGLNRLTSAGGYEPGSIIVLLDKPKRLKTTALMNVTRGYLRSKHKVILFDLENGQESIATRLEQSAGRVSKREIIKGSRDKDIAKILRRYSRVGGEVYIRRLPAGCTTVDMQIVIDKVYRDHGIIFDDIIIDYIGLMGALSGRVDDNGRIGDAYTDIGNLVDRNSFKHCWTAHHVVRGAGKRQSTRYLGEDIAKAIDIIRHSHVILGLNATPEERENGIVRMEIVEQRDGLPEGRVFFRVDSPTQRMDELTKKEISELTLAGILYDPYKDDDEPEDKKTGDI